jgi:preprotein translocase subunit SecG
MGLHHTHTHHQLISIITAIKAIVTAIDKLLQVQKEDDSGNSTDAQSKKQSTARGVEGGGGSNGGV